MKTLLLSLTLILASLFIVAQSVNIKEADLKNIDGFNVSTNDVFNTEGFTLLVFWKSGNAKCCENLESLQNAWTTTLKEKGVKMVAICVDCIGSWTHVKPYVNARLWDFEVFVDVNGNFKRAMNVNAVPSIIILDEKWEVVCRQNGFCAGDDSFICEMIESKISGK